jgi:CMP-N-acetylneuraminic acid synthetase
MKYYLIPARKGSKGFPNKNRKLFSQTVNIIPPELYSQVILASDDKVLLNQAVDLGWKTVVRSPENAADTAPPTDFMNLVISELNLQPEDTIVLLYLTYPYRQWNEVEQIISFFEEIEAKSLLCCQPVLSHPYLCIQQDGFYGKFIVDHQLHRRQDYPTYYEVSHYVCVYTVSEVSSLKPNLYNDQTIFYPISRVVDVDLPTDICA